jgi:hypothetical protein
VKALYVIITRALGLTTKKLRQGRKPY